MSKFPTINKISSALGVLDAFKAAGPNVQPDTPEEMREK